ncbi:MAG: PTS sugar transporter subunit IIC [Firmicutes bacterium]|nr:PTS sugar transporter subunit IIC [Bacillota bacterium]
MHNVLLMAIVSGLWYWFAAGLAGYTLFSMLKSPTFIGFTLGLLWGDPVVGIIAGGSIEVVYLGLVAPGGNIPSDKALAALVAVPLVLMSDMSVELAVSVAVPVGAIGVLVNNVRRYANAMFVHKADKLALEGDVKGIWRAATLYPLALGFVMRFPIVFVANYFGADLINQLLMVIPEWFLHGMTVMGGVLPALGFATTIFMIGKKEYMPLFFFGFFVVKYSGLTTVGAAIFGLIIAFIIMNLGGFPSLNPNYFKNDQANATNVRSNQSALDRMMGK